MLTFTTIATLLAAALAFGAFGLALSGLAGPPATARLPQRRPRRA